jgi:pimeloyl-ACP methyl ester carboxylesterase
VAAALVRRGHRVFAPSLTGLGDRRHLCSRDITLATHVEDILGVIESEELSGCILVGHSYGGNVITGVGDRLRERVAHYVYVDAVVPPDEAQSWRWCDFNTAADQALRHHAIATAGAGRALPAPPASVFGIQDAALAARVAGRLSAMPAATYDSPIALSQGGTRGLSRTYVAAVAPVYAPMRAVHERIRAGTGWNYVELPGGHDLMLTEPMRLADELIRCAQRR